MATPTHGLPHTEIVFEGAQPQPYRPAWQAMCDFTRQRGDTTPDRLWFLQHEPVFTLGKNGRHEHVLAPGDIDVVDIDRGGQVTYHGPGQIMAYTLIDLKRLGIGIRRLVTGLERATIATLAEYDIDAHADRRAPGVYVGPRKIASLGLHVSHGCCYHGLALNVAMNLEPFTRINPCGYQGLEMTQVDDLVGPTDLGRITRDLSGHLVRELGLRPPETEAAKS